MPIAWDPTRKQLRIGEATFVGELTTAEDLYLARRDVEVVTLAEWSFLLETTTLEGGHRLSIDIWDEDDGIIIITEAQPKDGGIEVLISTESPEWSRESVESIMKELCRAAGHELTSTSAYDDSGGFWNFSIVCVPDLRTTGDLFSFQEMCQQVLKLPELPRPAGNGRIDALYQILVGGGAQALVGTAESAWLEVKSRGYDLNAFAGQVELAQDVARFANGDGAALLVLGFQTKRRGGVDQITRVVPIQFEANAVARYREVLDRRIYPPVEGLTIDHVEGQRGGLLVICIPLQPEPFKPYLVHGAVVDGRNEGTFVSIIRRRDEASKSMSPMEIHALLSAGRSVLRGTK